MKYYWVVTTARWPTTLYIGQGVFSTAHANFVNLTYDRAMHDLVSTLYSPSFVPQLTPCRNNMWTGQRNSTLLYYAGSWDDLYSERQVKRMQD